MFRGLGWAGPGIVLVNSPAKLLSYPTLDLFKEKQNHSFCVLFGGQVGRVPSLEEPIDICIMILKFNVFKKASFYYVSIHGE